MLLLLNVLLSVWVSWAHGQGISCKVPKISNGEAISTKDSYKENERLQYRCDPGYTYSDRAEAVCTQNGWTPSPSCKEGTCAPTRIANSYYTPDRTKYRLGHVITYDCKSGFYPPPQGNTARCTPTGWNPPPRCSFKPCEYPIIKHGRLYWESRYRADFPVQVGKWYYYTCDNNYLPPSRSSGAFITCTPKGWSPEVPCLRKCDFNYLEHGYSPDSPQTSLQGETVQVNCHPGFSLQDQQSTMTCTENGWSPPPRCIRVEMCLKADVKIENGFISEPQSSFLLHKQTQYKCKDGYTTEAGQTSGYITCLRSGWSEQPKCVKSCSMPVFENATAIITGKPFRPNDTLDYQCLDGYENRDGNTTGSMVCGEDGWSHLPTCFNSTEKCGPPPNISNGDITSFPLAVYPPWSRVEYQCQAYYQLQGSKQVTCRYAKWSEPPRCVEPCVIYERNMNENNIQLKGKDEKTYYAETGTVIEFVCKSGHSAVTSVHSFQATCREGSLELPRCE